MLKIRSDSDGQWTDAARINKLMAAYTPEQLTIFAYLEFSSNLPEFALSADIADALSMYDNYRYPSADKIAEVCDNIKSDPPSGLAGDFYRGMQLNKTKRFNWMSSEYMNANTLGLRLVKYGSTITGNRECWFSGKAVAVDIKLFGNIVWQLQQSGRPIHSNVKNELAAYIKEPGKPQGADADDLDD
jgi:hypothetical protein